MMFSVPSLQSTLGAKTLQPFSGVSSQLQFKGSKSSAVPAQAPIKQDLFVQLATQIVAPMLLGASQNNPMVKQTLQETLSPKALNIIAERSNNPQARQIAHQFLALA
jgi:hypothetical protein